ARQRRQGGDDVSMATIPMTLPHLPPHHMPTRLFARRMLNTLAFTSGLVAFALGVGVVGYHAIEGLPWIDAFLNAAMILTGMGPGRRSRAGPGDQIAAPTGAGAGAAAADLVHAEPGEALRGRAASTAIRLRAGAVAGRLRHLGSGVVRRRVPRGIP